MLQLQQEGYVGIPQQCQQQIIPKPQMGWDQEVLHPVFQDYQQIQSIVFAHMQQTLWEPFTEMKLALVHYLQETTVTDGDGNIYKTINIGSQVWMSENLKTTKYSDGTKILLITDNTIWSNNLSGAYCWYNNDSLTYKSSYGALYNWKAVNTGNLCPIGWHLPSSSEWSTLFTYLGGSTAGGKLKETGTAHWNSPNTGATNESGFTALPGGTRLSSFSDIGNSGSWWSSTNDPNNYPWGWQITYNSNFIDIIATGIPRQVGCSIRCLKD